MLMEKWNNIQKKYIMIEIAGIVGIVLCLIIGMLLDWNVIVKDNILIQVDDMESYSLTILQVQATVGTLIVAIIALITGNISDSYMGVSVSDFYLNIKPWKLKQKSLIFISLGLCLVGVISHSLKLYNIVFYSFIATLFAISISIIEIYSAFRGRNTQNQEIEAYINFILESDIEFEKKVNIYQNFVYDWEKEIDSQDKQSYEKYLEIFKRCMIALWNYETDEGLAALQQQCYSMLYCLLGSEKNTIKERGVEFLQDVYNILWNIITKCISEKKALLNCYKNEFSLFAEICNELTRSIDELNIENIEKRLKFGNLAELIQRTAIWLRYDKKDENYEKDKSEENAYKRYSYNYSSEINELNSFAKYIGYYLGKQHDKNNIINQHIWADVLNRWSMFSSYNIPKERCEDFLKSKVMIYFSYCYGLLVNGQENIVRHGLYLTGMNNAVKLDNKYHAILYISVHCYIYYLAERESEDCVSENIRQSAKNIWNDENVKKAFGSCLDLLAQNTEFLDLKFLDQIRGILDRYELFPKYESVKTMIIEYVVLDFYLFLVLFMSHEYFLPELLEKNIDDMRMFRYVSDGNEKKTKELFISLFKMIFTGNKSEEQINVEVDLMYDNLKKMVKKKQKERYIKSAKAEQKEYEATINEEEICEKIKNNTIKKIKEKFAPILIEDDKKNGIIKVGLLNLNDYTNSFGKKIIDGYYSHMDGMLMFGIEKFLYQRRVVEFRNRFDDFSDDKEFMEYLEANNLHLLLGSQFILRNRNYRFTTEFNSFLDDYETIYTAVINDGMALKKNAIQVCLHDVNVSIHSPSIKEIGAKYDQETGKYNYSIISGLPIDFEESELREFLYNNRKVINVTAKISIQVNEKPSGTIITGRSRS